MLGDVHIFTVFAPSMILGKKCSLDLFIRCEVDIFADEKEVTDTIFPSFVQKDFSSFFRLTLIGIFPFILTVGKLTMWSSSATHLQRKFKITLLHMLLQTYS